MSQMSFSDAEQTGKRKKTRRELFLEEMEQVIPWKALIREIYTRIDPRKQLDHFRFNPHADYGVGLGHKQSQAHSRAGRQQKEFLLHPLNPVGQFANCISQSVK